MDEQETYITHHVQQQVRERDRNTEKLVENEKLGMITQSQALTLTGKADMDPN